MSVVGGGAGVGGGIGGNFGSKHHRIKDNVSVSVSVSHDNQSLSVFICRYSGAYFVGMEVTSLCVLW